MFAPTAKMLICALALAMPAFAFAQPGPDCAFGGCGGGKSPIDRFERQADRLGLDEATLDEIRALFDASKAEAEPLREELRAAQDALHAAIAAGDHESAMAGIDEVSRFRVELHKLKISTMLQVRARLTPEQRARFDAWTAQRRDRRGAKRGNRGHRGDWRRGDGPNGTP